MMNVTGITKYQPKGHEQITPTTATGLTVPVGSRFALISASVQGARFTDDGTTPTAILGVVIPVGAAPLFYAGNLNALQFFEDTAGSLVDVLYYG